jgi:nitroimidazol reductase NimA-like FMN-containing flavoprotein (pyridoxamine 5'-phosphate oxidase superfamily)
MRPMRRIDRAVNNFPEIEDILRRADTMHLGLSAEPYPYVVPLSFGFTAKEGAITLYFHGATEGFKHDLIRQNSNVCAEISIFHRYTEVPGSVTTEYESVIGFGKAARVYGDEAALGLDLLLAHCGYDGFDYDLRVLEITSVYRVDLDSFTAKRRFVLNRSAGE